MIKPLLHTVFLWFKCRLWYLPPVQRVMLYLAFSLTTASQDSLALWVMLAHNSQNPDWDETLPSSLLCWLPPQYSSSLLWGILVSVTYVPASPIMCGCILGSTRSLASPLHSMQTSNPSAVGFLLSKAEPVLPELPLPFNAFCPSVCGTVSLFSISLYLTALILASSLFENVLCGAIPVLD